jgi:hypothetical protein
MWCWHIDCSGRFSILRCCFYGRMMGTRQNLYPYLRSVLVVICCLCRKVVPCMTSPSSEQAECHLANRRATSATSPKQLCSGQSGGSWQAILTHSRAGGMWCYVRTAVCRYGTSCRLASVVVNDVPNGSSAFEMYQAVRCHIPNNQSLSAAEFIVK